MILPIHLILIRIKNHIVLIPDLFPQLDHQKRVIAKSMKKQKNKKSNAFQRLRSRSPESYSRNRFKSKSPPRHKGKSDSRKPETDSNKGSK